MIVTSSERRGGGSRRADAGDNEPSLLRHFASEENSKPIVPSVVLTITLHLFRFGNVCIHVCEGLASLSHDTTGK